MWEPRQLRTQLRIKASNQVVIRVPGIDLVNSDQVTPNQLIDTPAHEQPGYIREHLDPGTDLAELFGCFEQRNLRTSSSYCNGRCKATHAGAADADVEFAHCHFWNGCGYNSL